MADLMTVPITPAVPAAPDREATSYLGIIIFVASWAILFAALFMSYAVLRIRSSMWPPAGVERVPLLLPFIATLAAALSSVSMQRGSTLARSGRPGRCLRSLVATAALGSCFLAVQCFVWWSLWRNGFTVRSSLYGGIFYLLTCFHALHVLVGLFLVAWLVPGALGARAHHATVDAVVGRLRVVTIYWHFVSLIWGVTFVAVYLV